MELTGRVVDRADLLDPGTEAILTARLEKLERDTQAQMIVATTPTLSGRSIESYSRDLANSWSVGSKERNDGLVLLVAPTERMARIEVGKGLEAVMTNEICNRIIQEKMIPLFRKGQMQTAILAGTGAMLRVMDRQFPVKKVA